MNTALDTSVHLNRQQSSLPLRDNLRGVSDVRESTPLKFRKRVPAAAVPHLTRLAHSRLLENLERYGNAVSETHSDALMRLLADMSAMALGRRKGRYGYALPCGAGKSQAAVCWAWASLALGTGLSCLIASSRVDNLKELRDELIALGVPPQAIGVLHSQLDHPLRSTEGNTERPIMLVTHARLQGGDKNLPQYAFYRGRKRDLFIYDESLVSADHWSVSALALSKAIGSAKEILETDPDTLSDDAQAAYGYITDCRDLILEEMRRQAKGQRPKRLTFPPLPYGYTAEELSVALESEHQAPLGFIFQHAGSTARALRVQSLNGGVWFNVTVPEELDSLIVLDASLVVRLLPALSGQIKRSPSFPDKLLSYENVVLHHMPLKAGRKSFSDMFWNTRTRHQFVREIAHVINHKLPAGEGINVWTFKTRTGKDYVGQLRADLKRHGVDVAATIDTPVGSRPRINILTWGQETATNQYAYARHTVFAGVIHRDLLDLASELLAETRSLLASDNLGRVKDIQASEVAHALYQAASRSTIRHHRDGVAEPGTIWLPIKTPGVLSLLAEHALPGVQRVPWLRMADDWGERETATAATARRIASLLSSLPADATEISARRLLDTLPGERPTPDVWKAAQSLLAANPPPGWERRARSWVRILADAA